MQKLMLNTNVYCRPFDDKTNPEIESESMYSEKILELAEHGKIEVISSDILYAELGLIEDNRKRDIILNIIESVAQHRISANNKMHDLAQELNSLISDYSDCLHIISAALGDCSCLITCDKDLVKARSKIERFLISKGFKLAILTPKEFISSISD